MWQSVFQARCFAGRPHRGLSQHDSERIQGRLNKKQSWRSGAKVLCFESLRDHDGQGAGREGGMQVRPCDGGCLQPLSSRTWRERAPAAEPQVGGGTPRNFGPNQVTVGRPMSGQLWLTWGQVLPMSIASQCFRLRLLSGQIWPTKSDLAPTSSVANFGSNLAELGSCLG